MCFGSGPGWQQVFVTWWTLDSVTRYGLSLWCVTCPSKITKKHRCVRQLFAALRGVRGGRTQQCSTAAHSRQRYAALLYQPLLNKGGNIVSPGVFPICQTEKKGSTPAHVRNGHVRFVWLNTPFSDSGRTRAIVHLPCQAHSNETVFFTLSLL